MANALPHGHKSIIERLFSQMVLIQNNMMRTIELPRQTERLGKGSTFHHARLINLATFSQLYFNNMIQNEHFLTTFYHAG